ncbi:MAG: DUF4178 domain-containing protein [Aquabacterium sp.]|uniref:DUF4178 domain-containing protein n=1 Tax=Aquabacterium sp. TaxID=1872578 RepID=UPI003BB0554A
MVDPTPQRAWRALCSFCGAPVEFRSADSPMAVCSYCRSTLLRDGDTLRRIGQVADLFDDHSPLQLGVAGRYQGEPFMLVGRAQMAYDEGVWNEWHALFDNGRSGWLSEDNGQHVFAFEQPARSALPEHWARVAPGQAVFIDQAPWVVASVAMARVQAAEGELAFVPDFKQAHTVLELRDTQGQVLSIDDSETPPRRFVGRAVALPDLALSGLREGSSEAKVKSSGIECPNCGTPLTPRLGQSLSIACPSCKSVVDISQKDEGAGLGYYAQDNGLEPLIPMGRTGRLDAEGSGYADDWQVVGYQERCDEPESSEDEQTFWREYLLYNQQNGFAFLVDAEDGWSVVRPVTGVPSTRSATAAFKGVTYRKKYTYTAKTTYVIGEFYWKVRRDQRTLNTDYVGTGSHGTHQLNREQTGSEITWSAGRAIDAAVVMKAFGIHAAKAAAFRRDAGAGGSWSFGEQGWVWVLVVIIVVIMLARCSSDECGRVRDTYGAASLEYQQCSSRAGSSGGSWGGSGGGSWGGYSSGGSHK